MKRLVVAFMVLCGMGLGQAKAQVSWIFTSKKVADSVYELRLSAVIEPGFNTYSQFTPKGGPQPTVITFTKDTDVLLEGAVKEVGEMHKKHEEVFDVDVHYYVDKVDYVQRIKLKKPGKTSVSGNVHFMVCDDQRCVTEDVPFTIEVKY
jgi:hypothetical protein